MRVAFFDAHKFDKSVFEAENEKCGRPHEITFIDSRLTPETAVIGKGYPALCIFVNDVANAPVIEELGKSGLKILALRSAGYNHVDLDSCKKYSIPVVRVPAYSPHAVAEHAVSLLLSLNRKIHKAYLRVRELNFSLEGLVGFDLKGKTVGILGTGKTGATFASIMHGFGCELLAFDTERNAGLEKDLGLSYVSLDALLSRSDIISLHLPLNASTKHIIDSSAVRQMKHGVILINTGRGGLIDSTALIEGLKDGQIGGAGLDVYEKEEGIFFFDLSGQGLLDDTLARLLTFPNVLITAHQAFLTREALEEIARTTLDSLSRFEHGSSLRNEVLCS